MAVAVNNFRNTSLPGAWIVSTTDKGRKPIKRDKVFLKNGEEFEIELFNPLRETVMAEIKLNGNSISNSGLVLKPGERIYLDCFIDSKKKFVFETYKVDGDLNSLNAIEDNGSLEVRFYKEEIILTNLCDKIFDGSWQNNYNMPIIGTYMGNNNVLYSTNSITSSTETTSIETGRVEGGDISDQEFKKVYNKFENYHISEVKIKLLPDSRNPIDNKKINKIKGEMNNVNLNNEKQVNTILTTIEKLSELHDKGIVTKKEFDDKKKELLNKI